MLWFKHIKQNTYMTPCVQIQIHLGLGLYTSNTLFLREAYKQNKCYYVYI